LKLLELFSGIGGFSLGFQQAGYKFDWIGYSELDKYANEVFERRFPDAKQLGDITAIRCEDLPSDITILSGGFPCQSFSIAGKREGFNDTRGTMFFEIARILRYFRDIGKPIPYILLENVKGLLNHEDGQTFATIYGILTELGYTVECQIVNTRWFLPQNRERIFFVGYIGDGSGSKVFPIEQGNGIFGKSRREKGNGSSSYSSTITSDYRKGVHAMGETYIHAYTEKSFDGKREDGGRAIRKHKVPGESPCLSSQMGTGGNNVPMIAPTIRAEHHNTADVHYVEDELMMRDGRDNRSCLRAGRTPEIGHKGSSIRRLTPTECARLQGFPDDWNEWQSDTQRYKQFGNAVSVPVISAIAEKMKKIMN
jgi:DNA (cytosine-5)-methyltransferase 1